MLNFYKKNVAIEKSVKNKAVIKISNYLAQSNLKNFSIDNSLINNDSFYQRMVEFSYPIKFDKNSKIIISKNKLDKCSKLFEHVNIYVYNC